MTNVTTLYVVASRVTRSGGECDIAFNTLKTRESADEVFGATDDTCAKAIVRVKQHRIVRAVDAELVAANDQDWGATCRDMMQGTTGEILFYEGITKEKES